MTPQRHPLQHFRPDAKYTRCEFHVPRLPRAPRRPHSLRGKTHIRKHRTLLVGRKIQPKACTPISSLYRDLSTRLIGGEREMPVISNTPRFTRNTQLNASRSGPAEPPLDTPGVGTYSIPSSLKIEFGETATFGEPLTDRGLMFAPIRISCELCLFYPVEPFCPGRPYERSGSSPESHRIWARCWNRQQRNSNSCERCTSLLADFVALPTALGEEAAGLSALARMDRLQRERQGPHQAAIPRERGDSQRISKPSLRVG